MTNEKSLSDELREYASVHEPSADAWADRAAALEDDVRRLTESLRIARVATDDWRDTAHGYVERIAALKAEVSNLSALCLRAENKRDALAAEVAELRAERDDLLEERDTQDECIARMDKANTTIRACIAKAVKALRDGDGPVEDDFEGAVREALAILAPEGEFE